MSLEGDYLGAFEEHSPEEIRRALAAGASATERIKGKTPIDCLIEGYLRPHGSPAVFKYCSMPVRRSRILY
jgi:hypothetical protein